MFLLNIIGRDCMLNILSITKSYTGQSPKVIGTMYFSTFIQNEYSYVCLEELAFTVRNTHN